MPSFWTVQPRLLNQLKYSPVACFENPPVPAHARPFVTCEDEPANAVNQAESRRPLQGRHTHGLI